MQSKEILAVLIISLFFSAGCLGALEDEVEIPDVDLPIDWKIVTPRAVSTPDLVGFDDCDDLERLDSRTRFQKITVYNYCKP